MRYLLLQTLILVSRSLFAQECTSYDPHVNPENDTHTDPNITYTQPVNSGFKTNTFDWRMQPISPYNKPFITSFPNALTNPYWYTTSPGGYLQAIAFNDKSDYQPQDGWELVKQDFGYFYESSTWRDTKFESAQPSALANNHIAYMMLYNKYQAKLRVLFIVPA